MDMVVHVSAPIVIETIRDLMTHRYGLWVYCRPCNRSVAISLQLLVAEGLGDRSYMRLIFRCEKCSAVGDKSITWNGKTDR